MAGITFTLDVEDHREHIADDARHVKLTSQVCEFLGERGIRGTFFIVGDVAEEFPELVRDVAAQHHEIALHGARHEPLTVTQRDSFSALTRDARKRLEDLAQQPITGFRAPMFSLVPSSRWALDVLAEVGFTYSSSVMPVRHPLYGDPSCPKRPFRWENGLLELPCPVLGVGSAGLPFLSPVWLRNAPPAVAHTALALTDSEQMLWTYAHPYDFDADEPFRLLPEAGSVGSHLLWRNRDRMFERFDSLLHRRAAPPLRERIPEYADAAIPS